MHVEHKVSLPDHNFGVAERHKFISSVTAGVTVEQNGLGNPKAVSYSGATNIAIRSGKHSSSTPETHAVDLERIMHLENFASLTKCADGSIKAILIITVDGGPNENPRFPRVISCAIQNFKKFNLDALFIATNAPGRRAFNRVER